MIKLPPIFDIRFNITAEDIDKYRAEKKKRLAEIEAKKSLDRLQRLTFEQMELSACEVMENQRRSLFTGNILLEVDSCNPLPDEYFDPEPVPIQDEDTVAEQKVITSTGRVVPKRNPKAKAWVSPYGGKRK